MPSIIDIALLRPYSNFYHKLYLVVSKYRKCTVQLSSPSFFLPCASVISSLLHYLWPELLHKLMSCISINRFVPFYSTSNVPKRGHPRVMIRSCHSLVRNISAAFLVLYLGTRFLFIKDAVHPPCGS